MLAAVPSVLCQQTLAAARSAARGQQPDQKSDDSQQPTETLKVNVNVVQLFFNVKDKHGALIPNLTKDDFDIAEDGKPQTIKYFTAESNLPLTIGMMIDSSGSQRNVIDMEKEVGGAFLRQILTDKDEAFVISFDITVDLLAGLHPRRAPLAGRPEQGQGQCRTTPAAESPAWAAARSPARQFAGNAALRRRISLRARHARQRSRPQGDDPSHRRPG